jgi:cytochrome b
MENNKQFKIYTIWDRSTRWFHWVNVICVISLIFVGTAIFNGKAFGISGDGKILLKTVHVYIGYVFVINLGWRLIWGIIGNKYAKWINIFPITRSYWKSLKDYRTASQSGKSPTYLGHNPLGKLMVTLLIVLMTTQAVTGLVIAGTDLYMPPFGETIKQWVADTDQQGNVKQIKAGSREGVNTEAYKEMRNFRDPFIQTHVAIYYLLMVAILIHIVFVVRSEVIENNGLISAMFSGKKILSERPEDLD